jgi:tRNA-Thr(GGU) m(6)t(6)A37 methyltransferase TsaA
VIKMTDMILKPIGIVRSDIKRTQYPGWREVISEIVIDEDLTEALDGLDEFSHIIVLYWMHGITPREKLPPKTRPKGDPKARLVGRFATRAPSRPNPIGKSTVELLEIKGNILKVKGLDAIDGTPVLDIKPYLPGYDSARDAKVPEWNPKD